MPLQFNTSTPQTRRVKRFSISVSQLLDLLRANDGKRTIRSQGLPDDAKPVGIVVDHMWNTIELYLESEKFDKVPDGVTPPELLVVFTEFTDTPGH